MTTYPELLELVTKSVLIFMMFPPIQSIYEGKEPERFICKNKKPHTGVKVGAQLHFCDTELHFNKTDVKTKNISLC